MDKFKCKRCGACCRLVGRSGIPEMEALAVEGTNVCRHLTPDNLCGIYDTRPIYCRVDGLYELLKTSGISRKEWYDMNYASCETIREYNNNLKKIKNEKETKD